MRIGPGIIPIIVRPERLDMIQQELADIKDGLGKAVSRAINETGREMVTAISRGIRAEVNIKHADIKPHIKFMKSTIATQRGQLTVSESERLSLKYFGARQTKRGVSYKIGKSEGRTSAAHAFINTTLGGHVFIRAEKLPKPGEMKKRVKASNYAALPIEKLRGPSPWGVFKKAGLEEQTISAVRDTLEKNLDQAVAFLLKLKRGDITLTKGRASLIREAA